MNAKISCNGVGLGFLFSLAFVGLAQAAPTDLASQPLVTSTTTTVLPNVIFVLDDSGSMAWTHMPDDSADAGSSVTFSYGYYGARSRQCNGVYYDPGFTYTPPVDAAGTSYPNACFSTTSTNCGVAQVTNGLVTGVLSPNPKGAVPNGFRAAGSGNSAVNLSTSYKYLVEGSSSGTTADSSGTEAYYYVYTGSQTTSDQKVYHSTTNDFYKECHSANAESPGSDVFTKVTVTSDTGLNGTTTQNGKTIEIYDHNTQNFANWYSYYRTRMLMMKTAAGRAFKSLDNHYRVGFMAVNADSSFLNLAPFDSAQKAQWYGKLYNSSPSGSTPLRTALSDMGRLYAGKLTLSGVTVNDPVQFSCQQNFGILSTDGYWNSGNGYQVDGSTAVGNQDGAVPRPFYDGTTNTATTTTPTTTVEQKQTVTEKTTTTQWNRKVYTLGNLGANGCSATKRKQLVQNQTYMQTLVTSTTQPSTVTTITNHVVVVTNGVVTSDTNAPAPGSPSTANGTSSTVTISDTGTPSAASTWINAGAQTTTGSCTTSTSLPSPNPSASTKGTVTGPLVTSGPTVTVVSTEGPTVGTPTTTSATSGQSSDNLADIAQYYYMTDLRSPSLSNCTGAQGGNTDVCEDNVPATGQDGASWQHMTLFTLGLGASGRMIFSPSYISESSGDYASVKNGLTANPPTTCSWQTSGVCNWPLPGMANGSDGKIENIDDLWHAAVNGRGTYFSANNPTSLSAGLSGALAGIAVRKGASAAATTSNPNVTSGDNYVFSSSFTTNTWDGELIRQQIDLETGNIPLYDSANPHTYDWAAQKLLDANTSRQIYTYSASANSHLKPFAWDDLSGTEQDYFKSPVESLSQFCLTGDNCILDATIKANAAGKNLVAFIKGDRSNEGAMADKTKAYRQRTHLLGDIVNAEVLYVKSPLAAYSDHGYSEFITAMASRQAMVYVGANDGMLHAFNAGTGAEVWSYIPAKMLPNLYKLADKNYAALHQYYVDGSPVSGDICVSNCDSSDAEWKTILVAGFRAGGRGYYALDITDPTDPKAMWEFSDTNLGYSFGNPVITKLKDGTWVVLVASGYNNVSPGDGAGRLYVLNALNGSLVRSISTGAGNAATPSGLSRISAWVEKWGTDNTTLRVYGGDLLGNLWRIDINGDVGAGGYDAQLLAKLKDGTGKTQPITGKPALGYVSGTAVVYVGTGSYLGNSDLTDVSQQSFYAIKDTLSPTTMPSSAIFDNPRSFGHFVSQTVTSGTCPDGKASICATGQVIRTSTNNVVNFAQDNGWYMDFPVAGERANTDALLVFGTLLFNTNQPNTNACTAGGYGFRYFVDYRTGGPLAAAITSGGGGGSGGGGSGGSSGGGASGITGQKLGDAIASSPVVVKLPNNSLVEITRMSDGSNVTSNVPYSMSSSSTRRLSWRELINE